MSTLQRYDFDELTAHQCADGEWVRADEALARIAELEAMVEAMKCCGNCAHIKQESPACAQYPPKSGVQLVWQRRL